MRDEVRAASPPTATEIAEISNERFREAELPEQRLVVHALVMKPTNPADEPRARTVAAEVARAVFEATSADDFETRANAVPHDKFAVRVERVPAFIADGRNSDSDGAVVPEFAAGAFALAKPGDTSGIVTTKYGWHIIRLIEVRTGHSMPYAERVARYSEDIYSYRAHVSLEALLAAARKTVPVDVSPAAEQLMQLATMALTQPGPSP